jgi:hypothetical protein
LYGVLVCLLPLSLAGTAGWAGYPQVGGAGALEFDGVDDYVTLGNRPSYQFSGDMSLCAWYKLAGGNSGTKMGIVAKMVWNGVGSSYSGYGLFRYDDNDLCFLIGPGLGSGYQYDAIWTYASHTDTEWHHVAGVIRQGNAYLYVDGVQGGYVNDALKIRDSGQDLLVGKYCSNENGWYFQGRIDEVYLYRRGLSTQEIQTAMATRPSTTDSALVAYWSFDEATGQVVADRSGHGCDGYLGRTSGSDNADPRRVSGGPPVPDCQSKHSYRFTFDSPDDMTRIATNNSEHTYTDWASLPVQRLVGQPPDYAGMLRLLNLKDAANNQIVPALATCTFSERLCYPNEPQRVAQSVTVAVQFKYLFRSKAGTLRVWASNEGGDRFANSVVAPESGSPGSSSGSTWADCSRTIYLPYNIATHPDLHVVLELRGPTGTSVLINDLSVEAVLPPSSTVQWVTIKVVPADDVECTSVCGDIVGGDWLVGQEDYLASAYYGSSLIPSNQFCVEGIFTRDQYGSVEDTEFVAWVGAGLNLCSAGLQSVASPSLPVSTAAVQAAGGSLTASLLVAGKAYSCNPSNATHNFWSDRVFGFDLQRRATGEVFWRNGRPLNARLVKDPQGRLYQLNVEQGLVRLSDDRVVLDCRTWQSGGNDVHIGWIQRYQSPPLQDAAFDEFGDLYVVPVLVSPRWGGASYRAAAKIRLGSSLSGNQLLRLYEDPHLFATGVHEVEVDDQFVYLLDKHNWNNSLLHRYDRGTGQRSTWTVPSDVRATAFHVSRRDDRIYLGNSADKAVSLLVLNALNFVQVRRVSIEGMDYISDLAEYATRSSSGTIYAAGFSLPTSLPAGDLRNGACLDYPPLFKPVLVEIPSWSSGPVRDEPVREYGEEGLEHLSLPLSMICTGEDY